MMLVCFVLDLCLYLNCLFNAVECYGFSENRGFDREAPIFLSDETRLHNDLFHKKRMTHPTNDVVNVTFGLTLISIVDYDATNEAITINANMRQNWQNPTLGWNREEYGGIENINVKPEITWTPDIYAYANIEEDHKYNGLLNTLKTNIIVSYDGNHSWLAPIMTTLGCGMNVKDFPFDTQTCPLLFGSYTYDKSRLNLIPDDVDMKKYSESSEWIFKSMNHTRKDILYPGSDIPFSNVIYTVILKRKPLYLIIHLLVPNFILAFLTLLVFIQPVLGGERCVYVITLLLALSWFLISALENMPSSSEDIPLSTVFLGISLIVIVLLSLCLCYSIGCHYADIKIVEMPPFMKKYLLGKLAPYFGINAERKTPEWRKRLNWLRQCEMSCAMENISSSPANKDLENKEDNAGYACNENMEKQVKHEVQNTINELLGPGGVHQIHNRLDKILDKLVADDDDNSTQRDWQVLALVLDLLFFYFFAGILLFTLLCCGCQLIHIRF